MNALAKAPSPQPSPPGEGAETEWLPRVLERCAAKVPGAGIFLPDLEVIVFAGDLRLCRLPVAEWGVAQTVAEVQSREGRITFLYCGDQLARWYRDGMQQFKPVPAGLLAGDDRLNTQLSLALMPPQIVHWPEPRELGLL